MRGFSVQVSPVPVVASVTDIDLRAAPIEPSWILEGTPNARNSTLSRSADGLASTLVWDCTAGKFQWIYDIDETIYFLEGTATISDGHGPTKTYKAGDVLFIPRGAILHWHVEHYVRKVAFCRRTTPWIVGFALRAIGKIRRTLLPASGPAPGFLNAN